MANAILIRAETTCEIVERDVEVDLPATFSIAEIRRLSRLTRQVCDTARRRVLGGETVPNADKLFSLFETHTQLYRRGKAGQPKSSAASAYPRRASSKRLSKRRTHRYGFTKQSNVILELSLPATAGLQPGYLARGVALGHGISYAERGFSTSNDLWAQGVGEAS